jgi:hypothetical protein
MESARPAAVETATAAAATNAANKGRRESAGIGDGGDRHREGRAGVGKGQKHRGDREKFTNWILRHHFSFNQIARNAEAERHRKV